MTTRTAEYLFILRQKFGDDLVIDSVQLDTEWNTSYYQYVVYIKPILLKSLKKDKTSLKEFQKDGIAALMGGEFVFPEDNLEDAIFELFYHCFQNNLL